MTKALSWIFSAIALAAIALLVGIFFWQSLPVWEKEGLSYLTSEKWFFRQKEFGALSMIYGTFVVAFIALVIAAPIGFGTAIFTAEYLPRRLRLAVKVLVELLAGVPSVVYGLLGILLLRNWVYDGFSWLAMEPDAGPKEAPVAHFFFRLFENFAPLTGDTLLTAGILLAVMILPTLVTLSDDALRGVPAAQRRAARGVGLTHAETILTVSLPQAKKGLGAALLLALGRALGEAIAVFLVVGRQDNNMPQNWFSLEPWLQAGQTMASKLGGSETNIAYGDPVHWGAIMGLGLVLLCITSAVTWIGTSLSKRSDA